MPYEETLGERIAARRKELNLTQEDIAEGLGISPQAVSKWENDVSCPDIKLLPILADMLETTVDALLSDKPQPTVRLLPPEQRKDPQDMLLMLRVHSAQGDTVRLNIPVPLLSTLIQTGVAFRPMNDSDILKSIDLENLLAMANSGAVGKLLEVKSAEGDLIEIIIE